MLIEYLFVPIILLSYTIYGFNIATISQSVIKGIGLLLEQAPFYNTAILIIERTERGEMRTMIYKVFYQDNLTEVPVRENTRSVFVEADSEREVRQKLADKNYNIEYVQLVSEDLLKFEQSKEDFRVENL